MQEVSSPEAMAKAFTSSEYNRKRLYPRPGDEHYLHLSDLLLALKRLEIPKGLTVLDYGAGGSPYRSLFEKSEYRRADILSTTDCDYIIAADGTVPERSAVFDLVFSSQVLEHVYDPSVYLLECFRLLKPGGMLLLTTHGTYEDHGCPYDFQRWTADGLRRDLEKAGFEIAVLQKLTTGSRLVAFLIEGYLSTASHTRKTFIGLTLWVCHKLVSRYRYWLHAELDRRSGSCRVMPADTSGSSIYLCLLAYAARP